MNRSPMNYLVTAAIGAILWVVFAIFMGSYLSESPSLAEKDPADLAAELRMIFGVGALISILCAWYWYYYGSQEKTAGEMHVAKRKWAGLFVFLIILAIVLTVVIVVMNMNEGIESKWYIIYFALLSVLTFILFWITTFMMSPRTVKYIPIGKK